MMGKRKRQGKSATHGSAPSQEEPRVVRGQIGWWLLLAAACAAATAGSFWAFGSRPAPRPAEGPPQLDVASRQAAQARNEEKGTLELPATPRVAAHASPKEQPGCPIRFRDVTAETGIDFVHTHGGSGRKYIVETITAGLALFDYDNDGKTDIYFLNGRPLAGTEAKVQPKNRLYRNLGGMKFQDVTDQAGVGGGAGYGLGVCAADYDNDG
jgi:FG-GAP-like repeat